MKLELWRWTRHWIAIFFKIYCEVRKSFCSFGWQDIDEDWVSFNPFNISSARMDQWKDCIFEFSDNSGEMKDINTSSPWSTSWPLPRDFFGHYRHHYLFRHGEMENSGHGHSRYCTKTWTLRLKNKVCNNKTDMNCNTFSTANSSMLCHCPIYNGYCEFSRQICTYLLFFDGNKVAADASLSLFFPDVEVISILYDDVSLFNSIISHVFCLTTYTVAWTIACFEVVPSSRNYKKHFMVWDDTEDVIVMLLLCWRIWLIMNDFCTWDWSFDCAQLAITYSKLTIETRYETIQQGVNMFHWRRSGVFIVNLEHTLHLTVLFLLLSLSR